MIIRKASPLEFDDVAAVWEASVRATHHFLVPEDIAALRPLVRNDYLPLVDLRVAADGDGRIQGFVGVLHGKVEMLFIDPARRGQGIGKALLQHAIRLMDAKLVDVNEQNPDAVGFYRRMGFDVFERVPVDSQGKPFPILRMRLGAAVERSDTPDAGPVAHAGARLRDAEHIVSLSRRIVDIELRRDADALAQLVCDDYVGVDPSGALVDKDVSVGRYRNPAFQLFEHGIADVSVTVFGDAAVEIGVMTLKGRLGTFQFGGKYRYSHVWQRSSGEWKVKASQLTPILRDTETKPTGREA
jgi:putative acetyltransferase